jgi:EcsC protein family
MQAGASAKTSEVAGGATPRRAGPRACPPPRREEERGLAGRRRGLRLAAAPVSDVATLSAVAPPPSGKAAEMIAHALEWIYDNTTSGSVELAESYRLKWAGDREQSIGDLIGAHSRYAALVGFMTGFGGLLSTPIAAPLNISSVIVIQVRMIAAIAHLRGYALTDPKVQTLVFICLTGSGAAALVQELGFSVGKRASARVMAHGARITAQKFNETLGSHLLVRYGAGKFVVRAAPVIGGLVGGAIDASVTLGIGATAKTIFKPVGQRAYA